MVEIPFNVRDSWLDAGAFEAMFLRKGTTFDNVSKLSIDEMLAIVGHEEAIRCKKDLLKHYEKSNVTILLRESLGYQKRLLSAKKPVPLLYVKGDIGLIDTEGLAIIGTRKPTEMGIRRAQQLARDVVKAGLTVFSGLAEGINTIAHQTALECDGKTVAIIGTPLHRCFPKQNADLMARIAKEMLVVSQIPVLKYEAQDWCLNKFFFPERNKTMSAVSLGSIIVEASETSGTLIQGVAALEQGRKLFILESCFGIGLKWPERFEKLGGIRVRSIDDIWRALEKREFV